MKFFNFHFGQKTKKLQSEPLTAGEQKINLGILSTARINKSAIFNAINAAPEIQIRAIASRDLERAKKIAQEYTIPLYYGTYEELLQNPDINVIYNPLPNNLHKEWSIKALKAGKHVLCEKPIAANALDAMEMKKVADEKGLLLIEAFHNRYHPMTHRIKEIMDNHQLGVVQHMEAYFCFGGVPRTNIRFKYDLAGGSFMDLGCYPLNLFRYLIGEEPKIITSKAICKIDQIDDDIEVELQFPNHKITAKIKCSMTAPTSNHSLHILGSQGELEWQNPFIPGRAPQIKITINKKTKKEQLKTMTSYEYQLQALVKSINKEQPVLTSIEDGILNMRLIDEIYQKAGLKIRVSEFKEDI